MKSIGVAITTRNRSFTLENTLKYFVEFWPKNYNVKFFVYDDFSDSEHFDKVFELAEKHSQMTFLFSPVRNGIAKAKNKCLSFLKDCDYIFLFDDDAYPIHVDWADFFVSAHKQTGIHHFNYLLPHIHQLKKSRKIGEYKVIETNLLGGVMLFITKEVVEIVGGYNSEYNIYGYEHCGYTERIFRSGLHNGYGKHLSLEDIEKYIYSIDYSLHSDKFGKIISEASSVSNEDVNKYILENSTVYNKDINGPIFRSFE